MTLYLKQVSLSTAQPPFMTTKLPQKTVMYLQAGKMKMVQQENVSLQMKMVVGGKEG